MNGEWDGFSRNIPDLNSQPGINYGFPPLQGTRTALCPPHGLTPIKSQIPPASAASSDWLHRAEPPVYRGLFHCPVVNPQSAMITTGNHHCGPHWHKARTMNQPLRAIPGHAHPVLEIYLKFRP